MLKQEKVINTLEINNSIDLQGDINPLDKGKGRKFIFRFIEPGVAEYKESFGKILITKETLDKFIQTIIGCPVIIKHKDITAENVDKERVGVVSDVYYNTEDGWYYCSGVIFDSQAIDLIENHGWSVSCTYDFDTDNKPGKYHGMDYDMEFINGEFAHLALVPNPRYERANIVMNANDKHNPDGTFAEKLNEAQEKLKEKETKEENKEKEVKIEDNPQKYAIQKELEDNKIETEVKNSKGDLIMSVLNELESFIKGVIKNADDEDKKEEAKNEDKRKLIEEVGGILKGKVDDEIIKTIMKKMEEASYEPSEDKKADNEADEEEKEEKFEEEKEIANKKAKNEEEKKEDEKESENENEEEKDKEDEVDKEEVKNKCKNSMDDVKKIVMGGSNKVKSNYVSSADRFALGENY